MPAHALLSTSAFKSRRQDAVAALVAAGKDPAFMQAGIEAGVFSKDAKDLLVRFI